MDEPLGALDKQLREQMQLEIKHIHEDLGVTVVYVTHDQSEALTMSDRIAVFNDGIIQQLASPAELYERPQNAFVAQFIGENNRLHGKVVAMNGATCNVEVAGAANVQALAINVEAVGRPTILSLRPERVKLNPPPGSLPNVFSAQIAEVIYLGDHVRIRASVCGHDDFDQAAEFGRRGAGQAGGCDHHRLENRGLLGARGVLTMTEASRAGAGQVFDNAASHPRAA
ncbi:ABC transporter ATP-binding protein [Bradyrhizobium icense]|uniref:ABC transporter ATP-binding protein n=1 Tax=Bradyrhizobium icense TaxID=1274631 RepID=UPI003AAAAC7C